MPRDGASIVGRRGAIGRLIGAGAAAAVAALPTTTVAGAADAPVPAADPATMAEYAAWFEDWHVRAQRARDLVSELEREIRARVDPDLWRAIERYEVACTETLLLDHARERHQIGWHAPWLGPLLRVLHEHVEDVGHGDETSCCRLTT